MQVGAKSHSVVHLQVHQRLSGRLGRPAAEYSAVAILEVHTYKNSPRCLGLRNVNP